jgi:hypothetical protein
MLRLGPQQAPSQMGRSSRLRPCGVQPSRTPHSLVSHTPSSLTRSRDGESRTARKTSLEEVEQGSAT